MDFLIGCIVGGCIGVLTMGLMVASKQSDQEIRKDDRNDENQKDNLDD